MKVFTAGTFDLFHAGHVEFLKRCYEFGTVTVALNTDEFIYKFKNKNPFLTLEERTSVVESCKYVYEVIVNESGSDCKPTILRADPEIIVIGSDWLTKDYLTQMSLTEQWLVEHDISLCYVPYTYGISSTEIRKRLLLDEESSKTATQQ